MISKIIGTVLVSLVVSTNGYGALSVLTTTTDLKALVEEVGGSEVTVESFCKGAQDPHFLEAKPSYMVKSSKADLVVAIGLGLEVGWLPKVLGGSHNPRVMPGGSGYLEVGPLVQVLDVPSAGVSRADGDVHPEGNPHVSLDPLRMGEIAQAIGKRLAAIDQAHAVDYIRRADLLKKRMDDKTKIWQQRVAATGIKNVITYHKTMSYFLERFALKAIAYLEPIPGVPPTAVHTLDVIRQGKAGGVKLVLVENYFDDAAGRRVAKDLDKARVESIAVAVEGKDGIKTIDDLFESLVASIEDGNRG